MGSGKVILNLTMSEQDSHLKESESLNLRIVASKDEFSMESIILSVSKILEAHFEWMI